MPIETRMATDGPTAPEEEFIPRMTVGDATRRLESIARNSGSPTPDLLSSEQAARRLDAQSQTRDRVAGMNMEGLTPEETESIRQLASAMRVIQGLQRGPVVDDLAEERRRREAEFAPAEAPRQVMDRLRNFPGNVSQELMPPRDDINKQRQWLWQRLNNIADSGRAFGQTENYADAILLSQTRDYLFPEVRKELDALTLIYNQFINFSTAPGLDQAEGLTSYFRTETFNVLVHRPEFSKAFRLWEKFAREYNILEKGSQEVQNLINDEDKGLRKQLRDSLASSYQGQMLEDAVDIGVRFGEFFWRDSERAAFLDTNVSGSGEFFLRRLFHMKKYLVNNIQSGKIHGQVEVAEHCDSYMPDLFSSFSFDKFWMQQSDNVKNWYKEQKGKWYAAVEEARRRGDKNPEDVHQGIDKYGFIWDMSDCPMEEIDFDKAAASPYSAFLTGHVFQGLAYVEGTRNELPKLLNYPDLKTFLELKGRFNNLDLRTSSNVAKEEEIEKENHRLVREGHAEDTIPEKVFRQRVYGKILEGMADWWVKKRGISRGTFSHYVHEAEVNSIIGEEENKELVRKLFKIPFLNFSIPEGIAIPFSRLTIVEAIMKMIGALSKAVATGKAP